MDPKEVVSEVQLWEELHEVLGKMGSALTVMYQKGEYPSVQVVLQIRELRTRVVSLRQKIRRGVLHGR